MEVQTEPIRVLYLNSAAGIWAHSATDALLLNRLSKQGAILSTLSCDGYLEGLCTVRLSRGRTLDDIRQNRSIDCRDCKFTSRIISTAASVSPENSHQLGSFLTREARAEAQEFVEKWKANDQPQDWTFHGVPVARLAGYEVSLTYKSWEVATRGEGLADYVRAVTDAALTVVAAESFISLHQGFSAILIRSPHYANNGSFAAVAKANGIRIIFLDGSPNLTEDYTHLMLWEWNVFKSGNPAAQYFNPNPFQLDAFSLKRLEGHLRALERGTSHKVYSSAKSRSGSALSVLGASPCKPTAVLALSSVDESVSAIRAGVNPNIKYPGTVYRDQFEWVRRTVDWFSARPNYQLVVRVHPREYPNKRESRTSPAGVRWERELAQLPPNVYLDHPNQGISLYDLLGEVQVLITGWSSVGLEAALHGVPLITYDGSLPAYPAQIGLTGESEVEYFSNLEVALSGDVKVPFRENALKWTHLLMNEGTSRVGGRFMASKRSLLPRWANLFLEGIDRYLFFIYRPLDLWRGIIFERSDNKFAKVILEGKKNLFE